MAQELLITFNEEITELTLHTGTGGICEVKANTTIIWSRKEKGRFPDIKEFKKAVRDVISPDKSLGHTNRTKNE